MPSTPASSQKIDSRSQRTPSSFERIQKMNSIISRPPVNASDSSTACAHCAEAADGIKCDGCNNARYCSEECQVADRDLHELLCTSFHDFQEEHRPRWDFRRVIVLDQDSKTPRFDWMPTTLGRTAKMEMENNKAKLAAQKAENGENTRKAAEKEDMNPFHGMNFLHNYGPENFNDDYAIPNRDPRDWPQVWPDFEEVLGTKTPERFPVIMNVLGSGELFDHCVKIAVREQQETDDDFRSNQCIAELSGGKVDMWKGPIIIYGTTKVAWSGSCVDLDTNDFSLVVARLVHVQMMGKDSANEVCPSPRKQKVMGVKMRLVTENDTNRSERFPEWISEDVEVPVGLCEGPGVAESLLCKLYDFDLYTKILPGSQPSKSRGNDIDAPPFAYLALNFDPYVEDAEFVEIPSEWRSATEAIIVRRQRGQLVDFPYGMVEWLCDNSEHMFQIIQKGGEEAKRLLRERIAEGGLKDQWDWKAFLSEMDERSLLKGLGEITFGD